MKKSYFLLVLLFLSVTIYAEDVVYTDVINPQTEIKQVGDFQYFEIKNIETGLNTEEGQPLLPLFHKMFVLNKSEKISSAQFIPIKKEKISGNWDNFLAVQKRYPLSYEGEIEILKLQQNKGIYPKNKIRKITNQEYRGVSLGIINYIPFEYDFETNEITVITEYEIRFSTEYDYKEKEISSFLNKTDLSFFNKWAVNSERIAEYSNENKTNDDLYSLLIITNTALEVKVTEYAEFKTHLGVSNKIELIENIESNFSGLDTQDKIRNFIINEYENHGIRDVLLVGDVDIIPHRGLSVLNGGMYDDDIPADLYYAGLDKDWDVNNDGYYGDIPEECDFFPELSIGRFSVDNISQLDNIFQKNYDYQTNPVISDIKKTVLSGELLWEPPQAPSNIYGGDALDDIIGESYAHGFYTNGFPQDNEISKIYDRENTWQISDLKNILDNGVNVLDHYGHSNVYYNLKMTNYDVTNSFFTQDGEDKLNFIEFTQGCYCGSFDNRLEYGQGYFSDDCFGEKMVYLENGCAAFIGNSRYGLGAYDGNGGSQIYNRYFIHNLFSTENRNIGEALKFAKMSGIIINSSNGSAGLKWCHYIINVLGDPTLQVWTETPGNITENSIEIPLGIDQYVFDLDNYNAVNGYASIVSSEGEVLAAGEMYGSSFVFDISDYELSEDYSLNISLDNYYPAQIPVSFTAPENGYVVIDSIHIEEENQDYSNSYFENGEELNLKLYLKNIGNSVSTGGNIEFLNQELYTLVNEKIGVPELQPSETGVIENIIIKINENTDKPSSYKIIPKISISESPNYCFITEIEIDNADITINSAEIVSEYPLNSGDDLIIKLKLKNNGTITADYLFVNLFSDEISFNDFSIGSVDVQPNFTEVEAVFQIPENASENKIYNLNISVKNPFTIFDQKEIRLHLGNFIDDFEGDSYSYTTAPLGYYLNPWGIREGENHTQNGSRSFSTQDYNNTYSSFTAGVLQLPALTIGSEEMVLEFYQKYQFDPVSEDETPDGVYIEYSIDNGSSWSHLFLEEYDKTIGTAEFNTYGLGCFGGENLEWEKISIDLSGFYNEELWIRFVFFADYTTGFGLGYFLDDIILVDTQTDIEDNSDINRFFVKQNYPNPFNPETTIDFTVPEESRVNISIYNIIGKKVAEIENNVLQKGHYKRVWDGKDINNDPAVSGVYFTVVKCGNEKKVIKMILLK